MKAMPARITALAIFLIFAATARAAELHVVSSGGFAAAYKTLAPAFEQKTGDKLVTFWGPSMGDTPEAVPNRL
jgi:molybdate transport system substrate-binding protein